MQCQDLYSNISTHGSPEALGSDRLGCQRSVADGLPREVWPLLQPGVALCERHRVAHYAPHISLLHPWKGQQAVLHVQAHLAHYVQVVPALRSRPRLSTCWLAS